MLAPLPSSIEATMRTDTFRDVAGIPFEDRDLGAGQIIFRYSADLLEQCRAARVVEEFARQRLRLSGEPGDDRIAEALLGRRQIVKAEGGTLHS